MTREEARHWLEVELKTWEDECKSKHPIKEALSVAIKVLEQEPRWIPVSERLPENKKTVLVTFKHFVSGNTIGLGSVILLREKSHWHVREQSLGTYDVLAWMPLPLPWKGE